MFSNRLQFRVITDKLIHYTIHSTITICVAVNLINVLRDTAVLHYHGVRSHRLQVLVNSGSDLGDPDSISSLSDL